MKRFDEWTYQDAVDAIAARKKERIGEDAYKANRAMVEEHDFWQDGKTWVGPRGTAATWVAALKDSIAHQHVPGAASLEALGNFTRGLFGREANIQLVPASPVAEGSEEERRLKAEAEELLSILSAWWDRVGLWAKLRRAGARARWAGWGDLRAWIPVGKLQQGDGGALDLPTLASFEEALDAITLSAPEPDHCIVFTHPDTQQRAALFHYLDEAAEGAAKKRVELWYEDGEQTVFRLLEEGGTGREVDRYDWGGRLPVAEMDGELMITEVVRRQEAALDFAETNVVKVGETAGWRERYTTNAEPHGLWLKTPPSGTGPHRTAITEKGETIYFHPLPRSMGPAITTDLIGIKMKATGPNEPEVRATPGVTIADPVDPEFAIRGAEYRRKRVLEQCGQGHLAMIGSGEASGFAYEQARAVFRGDLEWHKSPAEQALAQLLAAVIVMAESMTREGRGRLERLRLIVTLTVDPGPVSPESVEQTMALVEKGLLARTSAMGRVGVEDVAAELEAIQQDPEAQLGLLKKRVEVMGLLKGMEPDLSLVQAALAAGWEEAEARKLFSEADAAAVQTRQGRDEIREALLRGRRQEEDPEPAVA